TYEQLLEFIGEHNFELLGEPGSEFSYSNDSYALLGMIIDKVSGKPFEKYLKENIFDPAGMKHTYVLVEDLQEAENITTLYSKRKTDDGDSVYEAPIWWSSPAMLGAGSIKSCVNDMLRYADIYRTYGKVKDAQILTENSVKAMIEPYIECSPGKYYGYGLMITPNYYGGTLVEHGGNSKAIASQFVVIPERDVTGVTFTNLAGVPATTIMGGSLNVLEGRDFNDLPFQGDKYKYTKEELKQYEGKYVSNEGMSLKVAEKDEKLTFKISDDDAPIIATNLDKDLFLIVVRDQVEVVKFIWEDGKVNRVSYHHRQLRLVDKGVEQKS